MMPSDDDRQALGLRALPEDAMFAALDEHATALAATADQRLAWQARFPVT
jgi:hypothetical protein